MKANKWFILYALGTLLLVSGCLWGAGIISTPVPMYVGIVFIAIAVFCKGFTQDKERGK
ncbi:hypothetical protein LCGC14_0627840 [marine sediment metagenome]|uniref:Lipoprotein n=1 Tax=marine sediment metagenome TaxID=412755 RepID=A0A0F9R7Z3_9ZZZZ